MQKHKLEEIGVKFTSGNKNREAQKNNPSVYPQRYFKDKPCGWCTTHFSPQSPAALYCSNSCIDNAHADNYLRRTYGIGVDEYVTMWLAQDGVCKICLKEGFLMKEHHNIKLVVDHCHLTTKVRGLLCHNCNRGLGLFQDSVSNLKRATRYINEGEVWGT